MQEWNAEKQKRVPPFSLHLFRKGKKKSAKAENHKETQDSRNPYRAEMTGDSCPARAVAPHAAAAVDHADTELIGHEGHIGDTGFLCGGLGK